MLESGRMNVGSRVHPISVVGLAAALVPLTGCLTILRQGFQEVRGARAEVLTIDDVPGQPLAGYRSLEFEPATTTAGPRICPPELLEAYDRAANDSQRHLRELFPGGGPALRVGSEILYFQKKGLLSAAQCLTRLRVYGEDRLLVDAIVRAESQAFREGDERALAEASWKAVRRFLRVKHRGEANEE